MMLKQEDVRGISVLAYISHLKLYSFLQINHVNRIINQMWESKTDIGGSVFDLSTCHYLTFVNKLRYLEDNEPRRRFYEPKDAKYKPLPHRFTLAVWKKSMSLRYMIEAFIFFVILLIFQYEVSGFNRDIHISIRELHEFDLLNKEILAHGGTLYDPDDPHRLINANHDASDSHQTGRISFASKRLLRNSSIDREDSE